MNGDGNAGAERYDIGNHGTAGITDRWVEVEVQGGTLDDK